MTPPEYSELDQAKVEEVINSGFCIPFEKEYILDILPRLENGGFQESLLGLSLSTTRLIWRS
ncbi:hypothetical protein, partial [Brucella melitensis]|uniref:hypothetical protein n=1 Tax=Brucella melitensis TaxID=29459 RepID=UPI002264A358